MKQTIIIIYFLIVSSNTLFSQETIDIKFNEAIPVWVHTVIDSTIFQVPGQEEFTKYSSVYPHLVQRKDHDLYVMSVSLEKQTIKDYGFVMDKLNLNTGEVQWSYFNTKYAGGDEDLYHGINFTDQGNIELCGVLTDSLNNFFISHKIIDAGSGQLLQHEVSAESIWTPDLRYRRCYVIEPESLYLSAFSIGEDVGTLEKPVYNYGLNLETYDDQLNLIHTDRHLFDFDTLGAFSIDQSNFTHRLNSNTLVSIAYKDRYESWENLGTKILWVDISDPFDVKTIRIKEFSDILPGTKSSFLLQRFKTMNNTIHLSFYYPNFDIQKYTCYILWLDEEGNIKTFIPIPKHGEHIYELCDMIYADDRMAYFLATPSMTGKPGFDILQINHGVDSVRYISSLTSVEDDESLKNFFIQQAYEDGYFIMGGYATKVGQGTKTALKIYCFKTDDLGIDFQTSSDNELSTENKIFSVFPNPTTGNAYIKCDHCGNHTIKLMDQFGRIVHTQTTGTQFTQIDLSHVENGIYFLQLLDEKDLNIPGNYKIIKLK